MPTTLAIYAFLFATTTGYALLLAWLQRALRIEPDLTWLEVAIGVALCLVAPYLDQKWHGPLTVDIYQWRVWQAFIVGGIPIAAWQIGQSIHARIQVERGIRGLRDNATKTTTEVASSRGEDAQTGDRTRGRRD